MTRGALLAGAVAVALGAWFLVVLRPVLEQRTHARVEAERARRHRRLEDAALALSERVDRAAGAARALAEAAALRAALDDPGGPDGPRSWALVDDLLGRLASADVEVLSVLLADGTVVAAFHRRGARGAPPLAAPAPPAVAARALRGPSLALDLQGARLLAAVAVAGADRAAVVLAEVDAADELARAADVGGEEWALVDAGGEEERVLAPAGGAPLPRPPGLSRRGGGTLVVDRTIHGVVPVEGVPRGAWQLRARVPARSGGEVSRELLETLVVGGLPLLALLYLVLKGRRQREAERQNRFFQTVFDAITDPLVVVDAALVVQRANRAATTRLGPALVGRPYAEAVARGRADPAAEEEAAREVLRTGQPRRAEVQDAAGNAWQVARYPMRAEGGEVTGLVEYARDVTHTKRLQAQLVQSEKLSTLGEMAAGIAHEINNPIGVVSMFAQLLQEEVKERLGEEAPALEKLRTIEEQTAAVGEIVQGLLRFSRKSEGPMARVDLRAAAERALSLVEHRKLLSGVTLERALDVTPAPEVLGNEGQLSQVVLNLVVNAAHAMQGRGEGAPLGRVDGEDAPPGRVAGTLRLSIARARDDDYPPGRPYGEVEGNADRVRLTVSDTGHGIPPEALDRLFEPFFTTKPSGEGTGLGLSVSFGIIRAHRGVIWVNSPPGAGTTFTLDLPAAEDEAGAQRT